MVDDGWSGRASGSALAAARPGGRAGAKVLFLGLGAIDFQVGNAVRSMCFSITTGRDRFRGVQYDC